MATTLRELIDNVNADDLPTNEFTIEDKDPMVILGKLNEVIAYLEQLQATINSSDTKANEALQKAIQAVADATQALRVANGIDAKATQAMEDALEALNTANEALSDVAEAVTTAQSAESKADTAISTANSATTTANSASSTAQSADTKADTAITTANGAKTTAEGIDAKATTALANSQTAVSIANNAKNTADEALSQVISGLGTKVYSNNQLQATFDADTKANQSDLNTTNNNVATNTSNIATNASNIATLNANKANQGDLNTTNNNVETNTSNIATLNASVEQKADKNLSNVTYPQVVADGIAKTGAGDRVIESKIWSDGKTWYRKWASGWKECGLVFDHSAGTTNKLLPINFNSSNFIITAVAWADTELLMCRTDAVSNSSIKIGFGIFNGSQIDVSRARIYCCGY